MATAFGGDPTAILVGNHRVTYNGVDLGLTVAGSTVNITEEQRAITADQFGSTVLRHVVVGQNVTVELQLKEFTAANLNKALPSSNLASSKVRFGAEFAGIKDSDDLANVLILHPLALDDSDQTQDFRFFKAMPQGNVSIPLTPTQDQVITMNFTCFPDFNRTVGKRTFIYGKDE